MNPGERISTRGLAMVQLAVASLALLAGCGEDERLTRQALSANLEVRGSIEQVFVTNAVVGETLSLRNGTREIATGQADEQGSYVFRTVPADASYVVSGSESGRSPSVRVVTVEGSLPSRELYTRQTLEPGFGYIETRDGTKLSVYVTLPGPPEDGPYPTIVNYSGYSPSEPGGPLDLDIGIDVKEFCGAFPILCDAPNHPSGLIAGLFGYATVGVNVRGTGCSGGAYDFFEPLQLTDGYDVIETVASQSWVKHNKVGMAGLSYPGISQVFVARTRPPSLAAITPLSVIADIATSTLTPGGIYNDGFALDWADGVLDGAAPYGQGWEQARVDAGDSTCAQNQRLHGQAVDAVAKALDYPFHVPEVHDPLNPTLFADEIDVPVFMAGAWQDEQTGGHFAALFDKFTSSPVTRFTAYNGVHADGYTPQVLIEWKNFLDLYVARTVPVTDTAVRSSAPLFFGALFGRQVELPPDRFASFSTFEDAKAAYEAEQNVRIIFESGAKPGAEPGAPEGSFEAHFDAWPIPSARSRRYWLHPDGVLAEAEPSEDVAASAFLHDPGAGRRTQLPGGGINKPLPEWQWMYPEAGRAAVFTTAPFDRDVVFLGHGSVDLYVQSTATEADLEVNLSEVTAGGTEFYVQSGWQRASQRALAPSATERRPSKTHAQRDAAPLPQGEWALVRVELFPFGHVFRKGSRLRLSVETPGGNRARWKFILTKHDGPVTHYVSHSKAFASSIVLPVVDGLDVPPEVPPCPSLRGQPCRPARAFTNTPK